MNLWIKTVLFVSSNLFLLMGCTFHYDARLYDYETDKVIPIKAWVRGFQTRTEAILPTGEHCKGESVSGGGDSASWGEIYSYDYRSRISLAAIPLSQRRVMTIACERGTTFDCEYIITTPSYDVQGHGMCRDNGGKYYRLIF